MQAELRRNHIVIQEEDQVKVTMFITLVHARQVQVTTLLEMLIQAIFQQDRREAVAFQARLLTAFLQEPSLITALLPAAHIPQAQAEARNLSASLRVHIASLPVRTASLVTVRLQEAIVLLRVAEAVVRHVLLQEDQDNLSIVKA